MLFAVLRALVVFSAPSPLHVSHVLPQSVLLGYFLLLPPHVLQPTSSVSCLVLIFFFPRSNHGPKIVSY